MAIEIQDQTIIRILLRRGSNAEKENVILAQGEPGYALDTKTLSMGDGQTPGGNKVPNVDNSSIEWAGTSPDYIKLKTNGVTNNKLNKMVGNTVKGNPSQSILSPSDIVIDANSILGRIYNLNGGNLTSIPFQALFNSFFSLVAPDSNFVTFWFNLNNYKWYNWDGVSWLSKHQDTASGPKRILYVGTGSSVATFDGGDTSTASVSSGPMWEIDTDYTSKVLRGNSQGSSATLPFTGGGSDTVSLSGDNLPPHTHNVAILIPGHGGGDGSRDAADGGTFSSPNSSNPNLDWTGTISPLPAGGTAGKYPKDSFNLPAVYEDFGNGKTSSSAPTTSVNILPGYQNVLVLKRTSRVYYVA